MRESILCGMTVKLKKCVSRETPAASVRSGAFCGPTFDIQIASHPLLVDAAERTPTADKIADGTIPRYKSSRRKVPACINRQTTKEFWHTEGMSVVRRSKLFTISFTAAVTIGLLLCSCLHAQNSSAVIPFQGMLTNQNGEPILSAGTLTLVFRIYDSPIGGQPLWEEIQNNIVVVNGRFNALLGSHASLSDLSVFHRTVFLGITVDDGNPATVDVEMRPRQAIVPVIFAMSAHDSEELNGHNWADLLVGGNDPSVSKIRREKLEIVFDRDDFTEDGPLVKIKTKPLIVPVGTVVAFAGDSEPAGWMRCDGRPLSRAAYTFLFSAIGTAHGAGDGVTTFNLPDYRGRFLRGVSTDADAHDPDRNSRYAARPGGNAGNKVGSLQGSDFAGHDHGGGDHRHKVAITNGAASGYGQIIVAIEGSPHDGQNGIPDNETYHTNTTSSGNIVKMQGGNETRPVNASVQYIIKVSP